MGTEHDLIYRGPLLARFNKVKMDSGPFHQGVQFAIDVARDWTEEAPAVDAVPVVRCRDCIYWAESRCMVHNHTPGWQPKENDFCSLGERRR